MPALRAAWALTAVGLIVVGAATARPVPLALGVLVLLAGLVARVWARLALARLELERSVPQRRAFVGERMEVRYRLRNRKLLPLPWVAVSDRIDEALLPAGGVVRATPTLQARLLVHSTSVGWREQVRWTRSLRCTRRGYFGIGPARIESGDPFGFLQVERREPAVHRVAVYPQPAELPSTAPLGRRPLGAARGGSPIFEDPSLIVGIRDYRPGDPLKRVDWKATARRGRLQSREFEPSTAVQLVIVIDLQTMPRPWEGYDPALLDHLLGLATTLAIRAHRSGMAVGLLSNCSFPEADRLLEVAPARGETQLLRVLEALAMATPFLLVEVDRLLTIRTRSFPLGASVVCVSANPNADLAAPLLAVKRHGHPVALVWGGREEDAPVVGLPGVGVTHAPLPSAWRRPAQAAT